VCSANGKIACLVEWCSAPYHCDMAFRIKICGITNVEDALAAVDAGADAIGLNFYAGSPRCTSIREASRIADALEGDALRVAVFVNESVKNIHHICAEAEILRVQLHGDETPAFVAALQTDFQIIRARRLDERGMSAIQEDIAACRVLNTLAPSAVLIDAATGGQFGGTGKTVDWQRVVNYEKWLGNVPLVLAGGLRPENVAEAIRVVRPQAVDVASGVESSPGKKDAAKMRDFVAASRAALS
jgi:phosphoribosylanthranilate isomerase